MRRNILSKIATSLSISALLFSCETPDVGFFSEEGIKMREDTMTVVRGIYQLSSIPRVDGSTRPLTFEFIQIYDLKTGETASDFFQEYPMKLWSSPYDGLMDTTFDLVNEKLIDTVMVPLLINPRSGQLAFNSTTMNVKSGLYGVDIKVSNSKSSKVFEKFGIAKLQLIPWQLVVAPRDYFNGFTTKTEAIPPATAAYTAVEMKQVENNTHPQRGFYKVGESNIVELELVVKDSKGTPIPPEALIPWYSGESFLNNYHVNSIALDSDSDKVTNTDTSCVFRFPTVPYPSFSTTYTGNNLYLTYYTIDKDYWDLTPEAEALSSKKEAELGEKFTAHIIGFRNGHRINEIGKWKMVVKSPYIIYNGYKE